MRRDRLVCAIALVAMLVLGPSPAHGQAPGPALAPCVDVPAELDAQCGSITVPLDRANPSAGTTEIGFALLPHRNRSVPSEGTIVYNPGGPGEAVIAEAAALAEQFAAGLDRRDLLLVDPRGTGRSGAIACPALANIAAFLFEPRARLNAAVGACGRELGSGAGSYGTAEVADDVDAVRAALGVDRVDLWGKSYGTYLWTVYAGRHPEHIRSIVLAGAFPIDFDVWGRDRLAASRRAIGIVCRRSRACRGRTVLRDLATVAAVLRRNPVSFTITAGDRRIRTRLDEEGLAGLFYTSGAAPLFGLLPAALASASAGDLAPLRRVAEFFLLLKAAVFSSPGFPVAFAPNFAVACHDYPRPFSYADSPAARRAGYRRALRALDRRDFAPFSPAAWAHSGIEGSDGCIDWPDHATAGPALPPGTPLPDVPVLVVSGELDANTPTSAGRELARRYPGATVMEIPNIGHPPTDDPCATRLGLRFVATLEVDERACASTGSPPPVAGRDPVWAAGLRLVHSAGTRAQRRALAVVVATAADLAERAPLLAPFPALSGLRGGRYIARGARGIRLAGVRVVRDARISGVLRPGERRTTGTVRLTGRGVPDGRLRVRLTAAGRGRATGLLGGRRVDLAFRLA